MKVRGAKSFTIVLWGTLSTLATAEVACAQSGQNLPDIFPYQSLHLFADREPGQLANLDGDRFAKQIALHKVSVVEFTLSTCLACHSTSPEITELVSKFNGQVQYLSLDLNRNLGLSYKYDIPKVPAVLVFKDGRLVKKFLPYSTAQKQNLSFIIERELGRFKPTLATEPTGYK